MTRGLLSFLSHNMIALIALFVALGGTAYAATALPAGSVGTKQLKNAAVTSSKIKTNAVNSAKVADNSLTGADLLESSLGQVPSAANAATATNATHADAASNADAVGGVSAADLMQGGGSIISARLTEPLNSGNGAILSVPGFGSIEASSGSGGIPNYRLFWRNGLSGTTVDAWYTVGGTTTYVSIAPGSGTYVAPIDTAADGTYTLRVSYGTHTATVITSAHAGATGGVFSSQAIVQ